MATAVNDFLLSLAAAIAAATSLQLTGAPRAIWSGAADEENAASPFTVLRIYGGDEPGAFAGMRVPSLRIQHDTRGGDAAAVLAQGWAVHEAMLDSQGRPQMHWNIAGKRFNGSTGAIETDTVGNWIVRLVRFATAPGVAGRDDKGRWTVTGNFQVDFERA